MASEHYGTVATVAHEHGLKVYGEALEDNRPLIHTSVHQPLDDKVPALSLFIFGQYFNRHETWAEMARSWVDYLARSSFMLQQGRNFADVAYFYGEEAPLTGLFGDKLIADAPTRYGYDFINADALMNHTSVAGGELVAKGGARYKVLYLGGSSRRMTLPLLRRIAGLAEAGATVVGNAPESSPSLNDDKAEFAALVRCLWSGGPVTTVGQGKVLASKDVEASLASMNVAADFSYTKSQADSEALFLHRRLEAGDVYFISNRKQRAERFEARFRVAGKTPEIWRADTGACEPVSYRIEGGTTFIPLDMESDESLFVVFRRSADATSAEIKKATLSPVANIDGSWNIAFQSGRGAPASIKLDSLGSLSEHADAGVKYFSGVATYTHTFRLPKGNRPGAPLFLDLGEVRDVAEMYANGKRVGTVWHAPYRIDIGGAVKAGRNQLEVRVANLWVNRLIGDAQAEASKVTYTALPAYRADAPLRRSGLIGPVQLFRPD